MTTSNMVTRKLAVGNWSWSSVSGWGRVGWQHPGSEGPWCRLGWLARRGGGGCVPGQAREERGCKQRKSRHPGGLLGRGASVVPPRAPLLLHISTFHASPPRMPNLAHAICRLSSEIGTGTKALHQRLIPPALEEGGEDRGAVQAGRGRAAARLQLSLPVSCLLFLP